MSEKRYWEQIDVVDECLRVHCSDGAELFISFDSLKRIMPASPALGRLKEEIDSWPHAPRCASHYPSHGPEKPCTCFKSRALRIIEELKP